MATLDFDRFTRTLEAYVRSVPRPTRTGYARAHQYHYALALQDAQARQVLDHYLPRRSTRWDEARIRQLVQEERILSRSQLYKRSRSAYQASHSIPGLMQSMFPVWGVRAPKARRPRPTVQAPEPTPYDWE